MIWVLAGTGDSQEIISKLKKRGKNLLATVVTDYGQSRLLNTGARVLKKQLNSKEMGNLIKEYGIDLIIDASHPFAKKVSDNAIKVSKELSIEYLRYERKEHDLSNYPAKYVRAVDGYQEAVQEADRYERIFLAIGSNNLFYFTGGIVNWQERIIARVLPDWQFIKRASEIGFSPANLLAMQGPFSYQLNRALLEEYKADVLVSKASGAIGGLETKIKAAIDRRIPVIIIKRPVVNYPVVFDDISQLLNFIVKKDCCL